MFFFYFFFYFFRVFWWSKWFPWWRSWLWLESTPSAKSTLGNLTIKLQLNAFIGGGLGRISRAAQDAPIEVARRALCELAGAEHEAKFGPVLRRFLDPAPFELPA